MKASESVERYKPTLRMYTNFAVRTVKKVCKEIGPRESASEAELRSQEMMAEAVGDAADEVTRDTFRCAPHALLSWVRIDGAILLIAFACGLVNLILNYTVWKDAPKNFAVWAMFIIPIIGLILMVVEFFFYKPLIDLFQKKRESHNFYCVRKPKGEVKRRLIFAGHADSSMEWRLTHLGGRGLLYGGSIYALVGMGYTFAAAIIMLALGKFIPLLVFIDIAFVPGYLCAFFFINYKVCVEGANDNLTGCMVAGGVLKFMGDNDIRFENTEVIAMFSGCEESGLRGAKAAAKLHPEWKDPNVETAFIALDTFKDYDDFAIYTRDMTGLAAHDKRVIELLHDAGLEAEIDIERISVFFGASDACAASQAKVPSALLAAMNPGPPRYYHTRGDVAEIMEPKTVEKGLEVALNTAFLFDERGLGGK